MFKEGAIQESQLICEIELISEFPKTLVKVAGRNARVCCILEDCVYIEFVDEIPKNNEVSYSINITCPQCGYENKDSFDCEDESGSEECGNCYSIFSYARNIEVSYSTKIVKRNDTILELN